MSKTMGSRLLAFLVLLAGCGSVGPSATTLPPATSATALPPATSTTAPAPAAPALDQPATWVRTFEGPGYGAFFGITLTEDGNVLAVGATNHLHSPPYSGDVLFMKVTLEGEVLWERTWGGDGYEQALSVVPAADGGYYVFGETDSFGADDRDFFLLRITEDGSEEWHRIYGRSGREWPYGMLTLSNRDLLVYGFTELPADGGRHQYAVRIEPDGDPTWEYVGDGPDEELVLDALETSQGDLILAGSTGEDPALVALDADGRVQWQRRYELPGWQYASGIAHADSGGFLLAGFSMSSGPPRQADTWLARCTGSGELEWETSFGDPGFDDYSNSLIRLGDGTYLIGAIADGLLLTRIDQNGEVLWRRSLIGPAVYGAMSSIELEGGGFLVAGLVNLVNGRSYDAILLRTNQDGEVGD